MTTFGKRNVSESPLGASREPVREADLRHAVFTTLFLPSTQVRHMKAEQPLCSHENERYTLRKTEFWAVNHSFELLYCRTGLTTWYFFLVVFKIKLRSALPLLLFIIFLMLRQDLG